MNYRIFRRYTFYLSALLFLPLLLIYFFGISTNLKEHKKFNNKTRKIPITLLLEFLVICIQKIPLCNYFVNDCDILEFFGEFIEFDDSLLMLYNETAKVEVYPTLSPAQYDEIDHYITKRKDYMQQKCKEHGLNVVGNDSWHKPNAWEYLINRKHHIIWCNIFKAASSSWMYNFNILAGYTSAFLKKTKSVPLILARKRYPRVSLNDLKTAQNDSVTFLIARHPFERLLSAYRDKFMFALPHTFHQKLGLKIISKYRKKKYVIHSKYPTFSEFVQWLLDEIRDNNFIDMHLVPATKFCTPCLINIDVIVKFETLKDDQLYLIERAGLKNIIEPEWMNSGKGQKTSNLIDTFFKQLSREHIKELYEYYKYDFEVFHYDAQKYFKLPDSNKI